MNVIEYLGYKKLLNVAWFLTWIACGLLLLVYFNEAVREHLFWPAHIFALIFGWIVPRMLFRKIQCPECGFQIFWKYFTRSPEYKGMKNPYETGKCPRCDFAPYLRHNRNVDGTVKTVEESIPTESGGK